MKAGKTLQQLAIELESQKERKRDFIADTRSLQVIEHPDAPGNLFLEMDGNGHGRHRFDISSRAHHQIAGRVGIPQKYYDRMREEAPDLLAANVNGWFQRGHRSKRTGKWSPERRMIRTIDETARAFLSDRYRRMDNWDMLSAALPVLQQAGGEITFPSCEVTESRMYVKAVFPFLEQRIEIPGVRGSDLQQAALVLSNSEVGAGRMLVEPSIFTYHCTNLMISTRTQLAKFHLGGAHEGDDEAFEVFADDTLKADDVALWKKVRDTVRASMDAIHFTTLVEEMQQAAGRPIEQSPVKAVEQLAERHALNDSERDNVLRHLIEGGSLTQYGLQAAVTRASQDVESYDRATDLERLGGALLEATDAEWRVISGPSKN